MSPNQMMTHAGPLVWKPAEIFQGVNGPVPGVVAAVLQLTEYDITVLLPCGVFCDFSIKCELSLRRVFLGCIPTR